MANIYVGFHDQRSCNRILKPPGGGTSNIFGTDSIPDVVPQNSPRNEDKYGCAIQQILQSETVSTVTKKEEKSSTTNGADIIEQNVCSTESIKNGETNSHNNHQEITQENGHATPDVVAEVTCKVEQVKIEEKSFKALVTETDSAGNTKIITNDGNTEASVEKQTSIKRGTTIEDILKQDDVEEKKRVKSPQQRVPPGGYSSGLW